MSKLSDEIKTDRKNRNIRFNDGEWATIKVAAEKIGLTASEFIRSSVLERAHSLVKN